jgi:hypothetical protein
MEHSSSYEAHSRSDTPEIFGFLFFRWMFTMFIRICHRILLLCKFNTAHTHTGLPFLKASF